MKKANFTFWGSMLIVCAVIISQFISGQGSISPAFAKSDSGVANKKIDILVSTSTFPSNLWPTFYTTQSGDTGNQSVDVMRAQDQSGTEDNPDAYVLFTTPNVIYTGIQQFEIPSDLSPESIQSITLKVNFKGSAVANQKWTWSIYNVANWTWIPIGTNQNAIADTWTLLNFPVTQPGQFVNSTGHILIQLQSDNPTGDAKIDYETIELTYKETSPVFTPTALPTKVMTNTPTSTTISSTLTSTFPSNLWPTFYTTQSGATGNQSVDFMRVQDQSGTQDNPNAYVLFTTPNVIYTGIRQFEIPSDLSPASIQSITLKVNFKGSAVANQKWTWSIYNVANWTWIPIGTNQNAIAGTWTLLNFPVTQPGQFVNSTGHILIQLQSDNPTGDAKIDYETLELTYKGTSPVLTSTALPTKVVTNTPTSTTISPTRTSTSTALPTRTATKVPTSTNTPGHYYVSTTGSDSNPGSQAAPWRTIQKAVNTVASGNTVNVLAGNYPEFIQTGKSGITFIANGKVNMKGFYLTGSNNRVSGFTITNPASDYGIRVNGNNNIIEKNDISNTKQDGIWFFGSGNKFIGNYIHDIVDRSKITDDPHVDCFQTWGPAENIVFEKNICDHTNTYGSNQITQISNLNQPVRNITFKNNIFIMHDPGYSPMTFYHMDGQAAISNMYVINNTFVHVNGFGTAAIWFKNITGAYAINNLFIDYGTAGASYIKADAGTGLQIKNNAVYKSDKVVPMGGMLSNDIWILDPGLVDYKNGDFRLKSTSALINKGFNASTWTIDDFNGVPRPQGSGFDIGAFEYRP